MSDLLPYGEQFEKIVDIIESAKERAYRKVNEELILMYRDIGEYISVQSENAEYGDAFVQKLADFFAANYPDLKGFNRRGLYRMKQFYELYKNNEKVSPLVTQLSWTNHLKIMSEYVGKINLYLEALDREVKKDNENPSVGVILCASKDDEVVEFALSRSLPPTMVSEYNLKLIDKKLLQRKLKEYIELAGTISEEE